MSKFEKGKAVTAYEIHNDIKLITHQNFIKVSELFYQSDMKEFGFGSFEEKNFFKDKNKALKELKKRLQATLNTIDAEIDLEIKKAKQL